MGNFPSKALGCPSAGYYIPLHNPHDRDAKRPWVRFFINRFARIGIAVLALLILAFWVVHNTGMAYTVQRAKEIMKLSPPMFSRYHWKELQLPQHNPDLPYPEGRTGKYIWIANHVDGLGWGNAMQELMIDSYVAYRTGRVNVFDNYTWNRYGPDFSIHDDILVPSRVPLSAIIAGPLVGAPWPHGDPTPRTVAKEYWDVVCPEPTIINPRDIDGPLPGDIPADKLADVWVETINSMPDRCIEIQRGAVQLFSFWIFGNAQRLMPIWPQYKASPIITQFRWSSLVESAFDSNIVLFSSAKEKWMDAVTFPYKTVPGLLALHIRRGDYEGHCKNLGEWGADWNGFNAFPEFPDKWVPPSGAGGGEAQAEALATVMKSCFPTIEQIVQKVEEVRHTEAGHGLKRIFIMTNGDKEWVTKLKVALNVAYGWEKISSTQDLKLSWEQLFNNQAVDMLIGQRAQVVVGNGWSSLTSNVMMLRMARDVPPESNRFW